MTTKRLKSYRLLLESYRVCLDEKRRKQLAAEMTEILDWVYALEDPLAVRIFEERYINERKDRSIKPRVWWQVAQRLHYSEDRIKHIHSVVLNAQK